MLRTAAAVAVATALLVPQVRAQNRWESQVADYLKRAANTLTDRGYEKTHDTQIGSLHNEESESFTLTLHAGTKYALVGVCDNDCNDLDLRLYDADDDEVDSDVATDDVPIVQVTPSETQRFRVKVIMSSCKASPCWYGIGVYGK
jgi:hypothetical protein